MIRHVAGIAWHLGGLFVLPFVIAFIAALFFEVSEVTETLPALLVLAAVMIVPAFFATTTSPESTAARYSRPVPTSGA